MSAADVANIVSDFLQIELFGLGFEAAQQAIAPDSKKPQPPC
jgi:hypothetical protein